MNATQVKAMKKAFIARVLFAIAEIDDMGGFFPSVLIAQAAIESNWGRSTLSARYNNFFGIKAGKSWKGKTVNMKTGEVFDGKNVTITSNFRVYDSLADSIRDRNRLLRTARYKAVEPATTPQAQAEAIRAAGYCTATNYVSSIMATIAANNLTQYDE
ncbi:MAG: glucosaminidase domain-containing protein [Bacteroidales bacterium]|nr:glucosaminidase domain-containing protein [Bacteroidales bacterium]